jgi:hypothetical protein
MGCGGSKGDVQERAPPGAANTPTQEFPSKPATENADLSPSGRSTSATSDNSANTQPSPSPVRELPPLPQTGDIGGERPPSANSPQSRELPPLPGEGSRPVSQGRLRQNSQAGENLPPSQRLDASGKPSRPTSMAIGQPAGRTRGASLVDEDAASTSSSSAPVNQGRLSANARRMSGVPTSQRMDASRKASRPTSMAMGQPAGAGRSRGASLVDEDAANALSNPSPVNQGRLSTNMGRTSGVPTSQRVDASGRPSSRKSVTSDMVQGALTDSEPTAPANQGRLTSNQRRQSTVPTSQRMGADGQTAVRRSSLAVGAGPTDSPPPPQQARSGGRLSVNMGGSAQLPPSQRLGADGKSASRKSAARGEFAPVGAQ